MEKITVYSKENCMQCVATQRKLGQKGIEYTVVQLEEHPELLEKFIGEGFASAPIVETGTEKWSGYRPDKIEQLGQ